ncbi:type II secretion system protein GspD [Sulfurospirillum cavolei]|uniref:type II secretion system protein GspD n=1 Tax=Sulfurospirillum cavolei TaxID=366522 RepID=UPI0005A612CF|nr:hypothetical protein [Sulfurospirillum cavolei]
MKQILLMIVLLSNLFSVDYKNISFPEFVRELSSASGKNIVISGEVNTNFNVFFPSFDYTKKENIFTVLLDVLQINDLDFKETAQSIIIFKKKPDIALTPPPDTNVTEKEEYYVVKFRYLQKDDVDKALSIFQNVGKSIFKDRVLIRCVPSQIDSIKTVINSLDASYQLRRVSFVVFSTNNQKIRDLGTDFSKIQESSSAYVKYVTSSVNLTSSLTDPPSFTAFVNAMSSNGLINILYHPTISVLDGKDAVLESIKEVAVSTGTTTTTNAQTVTSTTKSYKKVGLKLNISNVVIFDERITFSLDLYIESLADSTETPTINSKHVQTHVYLDNYNSFLLAGINSFDQTEIDTNIPIIENIPLLGLLTRHKTETINDFTFSVFITLLDANEEQKGAPAGAGE